MAVYLTDDEMPILNDADRDGKKYVREDARWNHISVDYDDLPNKPAINGTEINKDSTAASLGLETTDDAGANADLNTTEKYTKVAAINELNDKKANKIRYPHIDWITSLQAIPQIPKGRVLLFDTSKTPTFSNISPVNGLAFIQVANVIDGVTVSGFGPYMTNDGIWHFGYFHFLNNVMIPVVDVWRDGVWQDQDGVGTGKYLVRFGFSSGFDNYLGSAIMSGFNILNDIAVMDAPDVDLVDIKAQVDQKQNKLTAGKNININAADPLNPVIIGTTAAPTTSMEDGYSADAKATAELIEITVAAETTARQEYDHLQDQKIQTLNGHYYPLDAYDFGKSLDVLTPDPGDVAALNTYAMTMEGVLSVTDIIDDTVVKNLFDGNEYVWNAATQAWLDWGIGNIATASNDHLGVTEGTADTGDGSADGKVAVLPGGKMETIGFTSLKNRMASAETSLTGKMEIQQSINDAGKEMVVGPDGTIAPGTSAASAEAVAAASAAQSAVENKVDKEGGKGLSANDFTDEYVSIINALTGEVKIFDDVIAYAVDIHQDILVKRYMMTSDLRLTNGYMSITFDGLIFRVFSATVSGNLRVDIAAQGPESIIATIRRNTFFDGATEGSTSQKATFTTTPTTIDTTIYINSNDYSIYEVMVNGHWWEINLWCADAKERVMMSLERRL
ncbi:MAG: hypothetical protein LBT14_03280 [Treponema sp.]|jgi:hypothetical protein|nr:hypothetical protein [Treponema sp.]